MQLRSQLCALLATLLCCTSHGYRILVYSQKNGRSQVEFMGRLADLLVDAGHDVTVLLVEQNPEVTVNGTVKAKVISVAADERVASRFELGTSTEAIWTMDVGNPATQRRLVTDYAQTLVDQCRFTMKQTEVLEKLKETKFDLLLHELFDHCQLGIMQVLGIEKHVALQSTILFEAVAEAIGVPYFPSITPSVFGAAGENMTIIEKLVNFAQVSISKEFFRSTSLGEEEIFERTLRDKLVSFQEKIDSASFIITNSDPFLDFPHSTNSRVIELGGVAVQKPQELSQEWKGLLDKRDTAVLISFGSAVNSSSMPAASKEAFIQLFRTFPDVTFIWKYETEDTSFLSGLSNVHTSVWVPQNDILTHPHLKLLISHGGMNSLLETAHRGVPVLVIPLFPDQIRNAKMMERVGVGLQFDRLELGNSQKLIDAVRKVLMEDSFVRHVEFAAKFGSIPSMVSTAPHMSFMSYYLLDVVLFVIGASAVSILFSFCCIYRCLKCVCGRRRQKLKSKIV
uniref:UDP-glucuronosyltransferase n=2 Tax=Steinernema glaseri TaxID=37863 RepID=A0A1I7Y3K7_9BILA